MLFLPTKVFLIHPHNICSQDLKLNTKLHKDIFYIFSINTL